MEKNKTLSAQAQNLKRSIQQRENRRNESAASRFAGSGAVLDVYEDQPRSRQPAGGESSAAVSALAAITAAAALHVPDLFRCELCQASFTSEPQHQQHLAGPVHRKAEEKVAAERARRERLGRYGDVADAAVAAANWQGGHVSQGLGLQPQHNPTPPSANPGRSTGGSQQQRPNPNKRGSHGAAGQAATGKAGLSHTQLVAAAHASEEQLSINGWIPPTVAAQAPDADDHPRDDSSESSSEEGEGLDARSRAMVHISDPTAAPAGDCQAAEEGGASGLGLLYSSDSDTEDSEGHAEETQDNDQTPKQPRAYF
ncbi:MAG: hypothetical protein WDW38_003195 [Sanguina aurantia]